MVAQRPGGMATLSETQPEGWVVLSDLVARWLPSATAPAQTDPWSDLTRWWYHSDGARMRALGAVMCEHGWLGDPVELGAADGTVWDGQHRICVGLALGWHDRPVPVVYT
jgi:hypothetical protein